MNILEKQNHPESLVKLAAQRFLYRRAKRMRSFAAISILVVALLEISASVINSQWFSQIVPFVSLLLWFLDQEVLRRKEQELKTEAAAIQEDFDCFVLDLPWPVYKGIVRPTSDRIQQLAGKCEGLPDGLENWYGTDLIRDEAVNSKIRCQQASCWWDVNLRRQWSLILKVTWWVFFFLIIYLAMITGITVAKFVAIAASNIRVLSWVRAETREQAKATNHIEHIHRFLSDFCTEKPPSPSDVRNVQDEIFEHRRSNPPVPECLYWLTRDDREFEMDRPNSRGVAGRRFRSEV